MKFKVGELVFNDGSVLVIKSRKYAVILESKDGESERLIKKSNFINKEIMNKLKELLKEAGLHAWGTFVAKESTTDGSDYYEYYDKELDNNGYLSIRKDCLYIDKPYGSENKLYQFNKPKFQSFMFDLEKYIKSGAE